MLGLYARTLDESAPEARVPLVFERDGERFETSLDLIPVSTWAPALAAALAGVRAWFSAAPARRASWTGGIQNSSVSRDALLPAFPACPVEAECRARRRPTTRPTGAARASRCWHGSCSERGVMADVPLQRDVLLAEDDADLRRLLAETLRAEGFCVVECPNGLALTERLVSRLEAGERPFDLVVSDVRLPGVTGLSVLEELSYWDELRNMPMVLITAFGDPRLRELARRFGAITLLEKPFAMTDLMRVVRAAIDGRDPRIPHVLLAEDDADFRALMAEAFRRGGYRVTECSDGPELVSRLGSYVLFGPPAGFDLVVSDIRMPGATALEILEALRECEALPPVVLITAFPSSHTREAARRLGVAALVEKPFTMKELMETADDLLGEVRGGAP